MKHLELAETSVQINLTDYQMTGIPIVNQTRTIGDLKGLYMDGEAYDKTDPNTIAYSVQAWQPVKEGVEGGLYFGTSTVFPGKVGDEYFMTKGHFHLKGNRAEFYWGIQGKGVLIMMDRNRKTWAEKVYPGSLHYIGGEIAHRLANTGDSPLIVGACWPSDAGHNYEEIAVRGFSGRLLERDGRAVLISAE